MAHTLRQKDPIATTKALLRVNQPGGFDCPGCAWPDPNTGQAFEFCENGVKAVAWETTGKRVTPDFFAKYTVTELEEQTDHWLEDQGRLTHPMVYDPESDHYIQTTWDEAFLLIRRSLRALDNPNQAIFYTSGRTSNEAAFMYQLFGRAFGTNNFPDCSNMCHESSGRALSESIGTGKGTVTLEDFDKADTIFIIGQNPGTNHPRRGARILTFNPLRERGLEAFAHPKSPGEVLGAKGTPISTHYYQPLVGGDMAIMHGIAKRLLELEEEKPGDILDHEFIAEHTHGFEEFAQGLRELDWSYIQGQSGLTIDEIHQATDIYAESKSVIACWAMGITQHRHAVRTIQAVVNLLLMRGNIGRPGAGACPVRGHSNVQGDRTVGITEQPKSVFLDRLGKVFQFAPPTEHGLDTVGAIEAMASGKARVFIGMGGNFASATPDTVYTCKALRNCDLTVHISTKLNRSHLVHGKAALILPCLGRTEKDLKKGKPQRVTVEDSMSMVHASEGKKEPASDQLMSEPAIVAEMALATLDSDSGKIHWDAMRDSYDYIRERIEEVIPSFKNYNERIKNKGGFHLRNDAREREWNTATGKANFILGEIPNLALPEGQLRLMTMRSHDQYNTTVYGNDDRYRGIYGTRHVLFMNRQDLHELKLSDGQIVTVRSLADDGHTREASGFRIVAYDIPKGCAAGYFPELNPLVPIANVAEFSRTPMSKYIPIEILA